MPAKAIQPRHLLTAFLREPWAISPAMHDTIYSILMERMDGVKPDIETIQSRIEGIKYGSSRSGYSGGDATGDGVGIVSLYGVIFSRAQSMERLSGATNPQYFASLVNQFARDANIKTIILDIDSPGGTVNGLDVAAAAVQNARKRGKKVYAVVGGQACSAGYYIASQADEILVGAGSAVGCIGVIMTHYDYSKYLRSEGIEPTVIRSTDVKTLGTATEPMKGKAEEQTRSIIKRYHQNFVAAVASGRGIAEKKVQGWAEDIDHIWMGQEAVDLGLADRVATLDDLLTELGVYPSAGPEETGGETDDSDDGPEVEPDDLEATHSDAPEATGTQSEPEPTAPSPPQGGPMNLQAILAKLSAGETLTAEEHAFLQQHLAAQSATPTPTPPATPDASNPVDPQAALAQLQAENQRLALELQTHRDVAQAEVNRRLDAEFGALAETLGMTREGGTHLRALQASAPDAYNALLPQWQALAARASAVTDVTGTGKTPPSTATQSEALAAYNKKVDEFVAQGNTRMKAMDLVHAKHPELLVAIYGDQVDPSDE
ncbi:S49 family peptidase [Deinococcus misasensis]|uniref:S49 family peptidase n=1 Tax=Deinococcus misasensis TaxID=392413 RepID=UPI00068BFA4C|nr:S49 family peptidase [Deinococcus misasensis]